MFTLL